MIHYTHTYGTTYFQPCGRFPGDLWKVCGVSVFFVTQILFLPGINMMSKQQLRSRCDRWDALYIISHDYTYSQANSLYIHTCANPIGQFWVRVGLPVTIGGHSCDYTIAVSFVSASVLWTRQAPLEFASPYSKRWILLVNLQWRAGLPKAVGKSGSDHLRTWWAACMISHHGHALCINWSVWLFVSYKKEDYVCVGRKFDWCDCTWKYKGGVHLKRKFWTAVSTILYSYIWI